MPNNNNFLSLYIPKIKADYQLNSSIATYKPVRLPLKIQVINGIADIYVEHVTMLEWGLHSMQQTKILQLPGNHFFIHSSQDLFLQEVSKQIIEHVAA